MNGETHDADNNEEKNEKRMKKRARRGFLTRLACAIVSIVIVMALSAEGADGFWQDVTRIFDLNAKLRPGMTIDAMNELLGPPADEYSMGDLTRYMWIHGEMGIEVYELDEAAYRVNITLPCGNASGVARALDALTRQGRDKYGAVPLFDYATGQYYWIQDGIRFAFAKYNQTTVWSSCTRTQ
jgi:hypothetical protein